MQSLADLDRHGAAYGEGFEFTDENLGMLAAYAGRLVERLSTEPSVRLLSLGIGHGVVSRILAGGLGERLRDYVVVEGSAERIAAFEAEGPPPGPMHLVQGWFEEYAADAPFDAIEMGFVLEHVEDPDVIIARYKTMLRPGGRLFMAVPNARSLHRLIGHDAGLLDDLYRLSPADLALGHRRYFDLDSFTALARRHGLDVVLTEGLFLKPLTTAQLRRLELAPAVWRALFHGGGPYPAIANGILIEARVGSREVGCGS